MSDEESSDDEPRPDQEKEADPFERLGENVGDRQGDPFEQLDRAADQRERDQDSPDQSQDPDPDGRSEESQDNSAPVSGQSDTEAEWFEDPHEDAYAGPAEPAPRDPADADESAQDDQSEIAGTDPERTEQMTFDVGQRDVDGRDASEPLSGVGQRQGDPFEEMDAFEQEDVEDLDPDVVWQDLTSAQSRGSVGDAQRRTYAEVSKHSYCEQCEHFSGPPDIHCTHEGTEIVEFLDMETVRLVDCPIVAERRELQDDE